MRVKKDPIGVVCPARITAMVRAGVRITNSFGIVTYLDAILEVGIHNPTPKAVVSSRYEESDRSCMSGAFLGDSKGWFEGNPFPRYGPLCEAARRTWVFLAHLSVQPFVAGFNVCVVKR